MRWSLRTAESGDADAVVGVVEAGFETYRRFGPAGWTPPVEDREKFVCELADSHSLVAEADGVVAVVHAIPGYPSSDGWVPAVHLRYLFVTEPFWGSGLALELHDTFLEFVADRTARLWTPAAHARARQFYEREGWTETPNVTDGGFGMPLAEYRRA